MSFSNMFRTFLPLQCKNHIYLIKGQHLTIVLDGEVEEIRSGIFFTP